ncbi:hypothetical protein CI15_14150 [Paraburkholderia monticola]|uniref:Uncharacterized protein n=1 Tax=Paraburkholderia monticola TaxID=1399968 RepID=A0A149PS56_9BURK|nr:hypothetical protein CI15_14150 [Paraburkholderia monticola]
MFFADFAWGKCTADSSQDYRRALRPVMHASDNMLCMHRSLTQIMFAPQKQSVFQCPSCMVRCEIPRKAGLSSLTILCRYEIGQEKYWTGQTGEGYKNIQ